MIGRELIREYVNLSAEAMVLAADLEADVVPTLERPAKRVELAGRLDHLERMLREMRQMVEAG